MPRKARRKSESGIYHVILRGINKMTIFHEDNDYDKFLNSLIRAKSKSGCSVYAYCLMCNHIHLLIKEGAEDIGSFIKRLCAGYVLWYNNKYARIGPLFQDRFKSEPVETDRYLLTVLRYIIRNPIKAEIVKQPEEYKWVSYDSYVDRNKKERMEDIDDVLLYFSADDKTAVFSFIEFINMETNDTCLEIESTQKYTDEELLNIIKSIKGVMNVNMIALLPKTDRDTIIKKIKKETGVSSRQLSRVLGISRGIVEKVK